MKQLTPHEREQFLMDCLNSLLIGELSEGKVLSKLRKEILAMNQEDYAALVGVSRRTLSDIENDVGSQSIAVINSVFKPFGLRLGLLPTNVQLLPRLLTDKAAETTQIKKVQGFARKRLAPSHNNPLKTSP